MFRMNLLKKLQTSYSIRMSDDKKIICHNMSNKTIVYDFKSWEKKAELVKPKNPSNIRYSINNEYLIIKNTQGKIFIYDTVNFQLVRNIPSKRGLKLVEGEFYLTKDNLILDVIQTNNGNQIVSININNEEFNILTEFENSFSNISYNQFVTSGNYHVFTFSFVNDITNYRENKIVKLYDPINSQSFKLISHPEIQCWESVKFETIHNVFIVVNDYNVILLDSNFKKVLKKKNLKENYFQHKLGYFQHLDVSKNGKFIVITFSESIIILRLEDLKTVLIEEVPFACFAEFSVDDLFLFVGTWKCGYVLENNLI